MVRNNKKRKLMTVAGVLALAAVLTGCNTWTITEISNGTWDPNLRVDHEWTPYPAIENSGSLNSCVPRYATVEDRAHMCRVIDGVEDVETQYFGDYRNWIIDFGDNAESKPMDVYIARGHGDGVRSYNLPQGLACQPAYFDPTWDLGCTIVLEDGSVYSGCVYQWNGNVYVCDYRNRKPLVMNISGGGWSHILHKGWDWVHYLGDAAACGSGLGAVSVGAVNITALMLLACVDGPM